MARLNEPVVSTDSLEALRRKFLRQNRDIARHNSTQSLKIRALENECARLLSENLKLQSDVLRLKSELEGSHVHRVADHALQIKEKMEAQLIEWGTMLASLGHEPMPKNRSPRALKRPRIQRSSIGRSGMSDWRRRETMSSMQDLEAAALQEGRLPPLWENKTFPRETLNRDEILALCSEAEEGTDSPDLGPPPVSRFVDTDPVKLDLTTLTRLLTPALSESGSSSPEDTCPKPTSNSNPSVTDTKAEHVAEQEPQACQTESTMEPAKCTTTSESEPAIQVAKANLKRKIREEEEKENIPVSKPPLLASTTTKAQLEKAVSTKEKPLSRQIKELPPNKRDTREKSSQAPTRKPLGTKSSNEVLSSPKKSAKAEAAGKGEKPKADSRDFDLVKDRSKMKKQPAPIVIPTPSSPAPVVHVDMEPESLLTEPNLAIPDSPQPSAPREEVKDTPPPVDISSNGETTRGNRRARAAVSYAEPNLRDKMRRPNTKQLFDAVAGEGKNIRRTSQCQKDDPASGPSSLAKSGGLSGSSRRDGFSQPGVSSDAYRDIDNIASPLVQKTNRTSALEELPASVTTDRKGKDSMGTTQDGEADPATTRSITKGANRRLEEIAAREVEVAKMFDGADVYEFVEASPKDSSKESTPEEKIKKTKSGRTRSRRLSSIPREDLQLDNPNPNEKPPGKPAATRKRASMATIKSVKSDLQDIRGESPSVEDASISSCSTTEGDGTTREPASNSRRRSMML